MGNSGCGLSLNFSNRVVHYIIFILSYSNRTTLIERVVYPFGLSIYGSKLYWTDWVLDSVNEANKRTGTNLRSFVQNIDGVRDLHVHAGSSQLEIGKGVVVAVRHF